MKVDAYQKSQTDDAQVVPFAFGMAALGQLTGIFRIDEGIKIRAIENQAVYIQLERFQEALRERLADRGNLFFSQQLHVVPETRCRELLGGVAQPAGQGCAAKPGGHPAFAGRGQTTVDGGDQHVLTERGALLTFGGVVIDEFDQAELLSEVVEGRDTAERRDPSTSGFASGLLEALQQSVGRAQIFHDDRAGAAVHAPRFDEVVVGMSVDDLALDAGHEI